MTVLIAQPTITAGEYLQASIYRTGDGQTLITVATNTGRNPQITPDQAADFARQLLSLAQANTP